MPALVTDATPWSGVAAENAGWCVPWADYGNTLTAALATPAHTLAAMGARGRDWAGREFTWERSGRLLLEFYRHLNHA